MKRRPLNSWNKETCREVALKCKTKTEFTIKYRQAYNLARKNGWLDEMCEHMTVLGSYTKRLVYAYEFPDKSVYVGLTYNKEERFKQHNEKNNHHDPVYNYVNKTGFVPIIKILSDYIEAKEAQKLEKKTQDRYHKEGWKSLHKAKPGGLGGNIRKWTKEKALKEILKKGFKNRTQVYKTLPGLYRSIIKNKWEDILPSKHLTN